MIAYLIGTIVSVTKHSIILSTQSGVGYEVMLPTRKLMELNSGIPISLFTYQKISEQNHELFGFGSLEEREFFMLLMTVSGIGPKSAMNILSLGSMDEIRSAIARGDVQYLTAIQGMGKKTAERLVVELKNKIGIVAKASKSANVPEGVLEDVVEGLVAMGYTRDESRRMIENVDVTGKNAAEILKQVLSNKST